MRIAIVNHEPQILEIICRIIAAVPAYKMAWVAASGAEAIEKCGRDRPDLILMDLVMPKMDGIQAICTIMQQCPCPILVVAPSVSNQQKKIFEAMGCGALDAITAPFIDSKGELAGADDLLKKIAMIARLQGKTVPVTSSGKRVHHQQTTALPALVAIGASTGGPKALAAILAALSPPLGAAVVIVQHVDEKFASGLADWLNEQTRLTVKLAGEGSRPTVETVLVAATNDHLVMESDWAFHYTKEPCDYPYRPSVDVFFLSLEKHWPRRDIAVLLTGMGKDGAKGLFALRKLGWHTIAQDEKTSTIYGMPAAAAEMKAAGEILPLEDVAGTIQRTLQKRSSR